MQIGEIGKGIAERRKQAGLSQEELARRLGLTRQAVSRWESGAALPTVDNLERAIAAAAGLPEEDPMLSGVKMTLKQMGEAMNRLGLEPVGEVGEHFDPDKHNAVMRAEGEGEPGTVLEVLQKGYRVKDRMLRYAMVKIEAES